MERTSSEWVAMAHSASSLRGIAEDSRWTTLFPDGNLRVWSDDFSNILSVLSM
jgi:hypothetical protein